MNHSSRLRHEAPPSPDLGMDLIQRQIVTIVGNERAINNYLLGPNGFTTVDARDETGKVTELSDVLFLMKQARNLNAVPVNEYSLYPDIPPTKLQSLPTNIAFAMQYPGLSQYANALLRTSGDKERARIWLNTHDIQELHTEARGARDLAPEGMLAFKIQQLRNRERAYHWFDRRHQQQATQRPGERERQAARQPRRVAKIARLLSGPIRHQFENPFTTRIGHK